MQGVGLGLQCTAVKKSKHGLGRFMVAGYPCRGTAGIEGPRSRGPLTQYVIDVFDQTSCHLLVTKVGLSYPKQQGLKRYQSMDCLSCPCGDEEMQGKSKEMCAKL